MTTLFLIVVGWLGAVVCINVLTWLLNLEGSYSERDNEDDYLN